MKQHDYMKNMQKLLRLVRVLHERGYEKLRIIPSVSPNGMAWRCSFTTSEIKANETVIASLWIDSFFRTNNKKQELSIDKLADLFEKEHTRFLTKCKGKNKIYLDWYNTMLTSLEEGELPYAFGDYFAPTDYWESSKGRKIQTLPNEKSYYSNY